MSEEAYDLVIKNGRVVTSETTVLADVGIKGETIAALGAGLSGHREIDAAGKWVTPGAVDIHVHMEMDLGNGFVSADDFYSGTRAAALGGTTTIVDFVESKPEQSLMEAFWVRREPADERAVIDYALHMTIGPGDMEKLDQLSEVYKAGCTSFKLYMAYGLRLDDGQMLRALEAVREVGGFPVVHAENWDVITALIQRNLAMGRTSPHWHPRSRPALLEGEAAGRVIDIATYVGVPVHIFHVSCAEVVRRISAAKARGLPVTGETCPQYLFLTQEAYDAPGVEAALPVCSPPLRTLQDQGALWHALAEGVLDIVTTDHCPFSREEKARNLGDYSRIPGGVPSVEMRFPAMYSYGVAGGLISENRWVDLCCTRPAKLAGLDRKGHIGIGYDADLVVFDPVQKKTLSTETLHENVDWTPYDGLVVQGWPEVTVRRGEVIVEGGEFKSTPGMGKYIQRG